jgi:hypothetical protein
MFSLPIHASGILHSTFIARYKYIDGFSEKLSIGDLFCACLQDAKIFPLTEGAIGQTARAGGFGVTGLGRTVAMF